jgi:hypothetical protein
MIRQDYPRCLYWDGNIKGATVIVADVAGELAANGRGFYQIGTRPPVSIFGTNTDFEGGCDHPSLGSVTVPVVPFVEVPLTIPKPEPEPVKRGRGRPRKAR